MISTFAERKFAGLLEKDISMAVVLPNGLRMPPKADSKVTLRIRTWQALWDLLNSLLKKLGEAFIAGDFDVDGDIHEH